MAFGQLLVAMFSVQAAASIAKSLFPIMGPVGVTALRLSFGAIILGLCFRPWRTLPGQDALYLIVPCGVSLAIMNTLYYMSLQTLNMGVAVGLEFICPLLLSILVSRGLLDALWALFAACGLFLDFGYDRNFNGFDPWGATLALAAGAAWSSYIVFGKSAGRRHKTNVAVFAMAVAAAATMPFALIFEATHLFDLQALPKAGVVGLMSSAVPVSLEMLAIQQISARSYSVFMSLSPVIASLSGFMFAHERMQVHQMVALAMIVCAAVGNAVTTVRDRA
jgi:inner membrane transporter RhtA